MADSAAKLKTSDTTSADLSRVPFFSFGFVEESIKKVAKSDGSKEITKGYKYFSEKYITDIKGRTMGNIRRS